MRSRYLNFLRSEDNLDPPAQLIWRKDVGRVLYSIMFHTYPYMEESERKRRFILTRDFGIGLFGFAATIFRIPMKKLNEMAIMMNNDGL